MAGGAVDEHVRRSVVPKPIQSAAGRSLWPAAMWTGLGAAVVCATISIVVVAACWLPVSGTTGRTNSAIRAGLLTFLASLHGGITVDGVSAAWIPLGMTLIVGLTAWRAGAGLADAAHDAEEYDPARLALAGVAQLLSFTVGCLTAVPFATLGTSRAPFLGVGLAAALLFTVSGGVAYVRASPLRDLIAERTPAVVGALLRGAGAAVAVYLGAGALLTGASLVLHHTQAERLSHSVGGGLGGIPVLLLGVLAAPNAAIAGSAYLAGPGFSLGSGTHVGLFATAHGTLPAFPLLAAVPSGAPNPLAWAAAALTPLVAGGYVTRVAVRVSGWWRRAATVAGAAGLAGATMFLLGWQGGGAVGDGRLATVGASPWQLGGALAAAVAVTGTLWLGLAAGWQALRNRRDRWDDDLDDRDDSDADGDRSGDFFGTARFPRLLAVASDPADVAADTDADSDSDTDSDDIADRAG